MKKIVIIIMVIALMTLAVTPALAQSGTSGKGYKTGNGFAGPGAGYYYNNTGESFFTVAGTITALDPAVGTVRVLAVAGSQLVHDYLDQEITLQTTETTRFILSCNTTDTAISDCAATVVTFAELAVGQNVSAKGTLSVDATTGAMTWTVDHITIGALLLNICTANYTTTDAPRNQNHNGRP